jgi:demethoxyubiquinone hydroxylase (CLK1/Coq7/Cat5 family)
MPESYREHPDRSLIRRLDDQIERLKQEEWSDADRSRIERLAAHIRTFRIERLAHQIAQR